MNPVPDKTTSPLASLRLLDYRLLLAVFLTLLVPATYTTVRIHFIADIPNEWGFNIASQISWLNIIYEVLQEAIVLPLFYILGSAAVDRKLFTNRFVFGVKIILPVYAALSLLVWIFIPQLVAALNQQAELVNETIHYIRLETIVLPLRTFIDMAFVAFVVLNLKRAIYTMLAAQVVVRFGFDGLFISPRFLDLGITGVAYSSISIAVTLAAVSAALLMRVADFSDYGKPFARGWVGEWFGVCCYSGLESAVRNIAFIVMILKLVNEVQQSGTFWVTNGFIWNWLLLPILAIGNLVKADTAINLGDLGRRFNGYLWLIAVFICLWVASMPGWDVFIAKVMGINESGTISALALYMLGFYMVFAFKNTIDSYLYGMGRLGYLLLQSVIVNSIYYGAAFALYKAGIFVPGLHSIAALFGGGMVFGFLVTLGIFRYLGYPVKNG